uniref:Acyltransferase n=1 Tax=uncultured bacterium contig00039 TaxID=1181527 RepID=A0A806KGQ3_9BACT|nr:hypothetical protein [uncultured bacterium contig00039]
MPNIGAMPIHHSKMDSKGMARIFKAITEGPYPLALAPEGQVSYFTDSLPHLENGTIFIGFQAASQMADKNINIPVEILPLSIHLRYDKHGEAAMIKLLGKIEKLCDISNGNLPFTERLRQCREYILKINENRYNIKSDDSVSFETRLEKIVNAALETAERMLGINSGGSPKSDAAKDGAVSGDDFFPRLYKVRQLCWDKIFLPGVVSLEQKTVVERNAMDLGAGEAWYISRHQELADFGWYFRRPLPTEDAALHNRIEYVQNLYDFANRTMGGAIANRVNIFPRKVIIHAATVINLTERLPRYKENKKCAIAAGAADLEKAYLDSIKKANDLPN